VPIDVRVPESPGWWVARLANKLLKRRPEAEALFQRYEGNPPLPEGAENAKTAYQAFQRKARTNFAELIVEALRERTVLSGFRTAAAGDENGDETAWRLWLSAGAPVEVATVLESTFATGDGYIIVGLDEDGEVLVTGEDPRQVVTEHDPRQQRKVVAALKMFHDDVAALDYAYLYLPGRVFVAAREMKKANPTAQRFNAQAWEWDEAHGGEVGEALPFPVVPVVRWRNKRGVGEFETHIDLLDRINHMLLQRMVIATMQAFRQRAVRGDLPDRDENGELIDYDDLLSADPGALWRLPAAVEMWESGQADLTPILSAVRDDVVHLAAVTRTPLHMLTPDAAAQGSAEGATLQREGLVFKAEDRMMRLGTAAAQTLYLMLLFTGDTERATLADIEVLWKPAERYSLTERASAATQAQAAGVPWRSRMTTIMQYAPQDVARMESERAADALLQASLVAVQTAGQTTGQTAGQQQAAQPAQGPQNAAQGQGEGQQQ
jgi:hypothetical protein